MAQRRGQPIEHAGEVFIELQRPLIGGDRVTVLPPSVMGFALEELTEP